MRTRRQKDELPPKQAAVRLSAALAVLLLIVGGVKFGVFSRLLAPLVQRNSRSMTAAAARLPKSLTGRVTQIADGDTLTIVADRQQHRIRLWGIEAPERKQSFGQQAKQGLDEKVFHRTVRVVVKQRDEQGQLVGVVMLDGRNVNLEMVHDGFAWWYPHAAPKAVDIEQAEQDAKLAGRGLWVDKEAVPPWEYRRGRRGPSAVR